MIYDINEFADMCGYFFGDTTINNGYGCKHPEQEEQDEDSNIGKCYAHSCPMARETKDGYVIPYGGK